MVLRGYLCGAALAVGDTDEQKKNNKDTFKN
jgi:hypothetical protein